MDNIVWCNVSKAYNASNRPIHRIAEVLTAVFDVDREKSIPSELTNIVLGLPVFPARTRFYTMCLGDSEMDAPEPCRHLKVLKSKQE